LPLVSRGWKPLPHCLNKRAGEQEIKGLCALNEAISECSNTQMIFLVVKQSVFPTLSEKQPLYHL
jgi:hypothetical protein